MVVFYIEIFIRDTLAMLKIFGNIALYSDLIKELSRCMFTYLNDYQRLSKHKNSVLEKLKHLNSYDVVHIISSFK